MENPGLKHNICVLSRNNREISHSMNTKLALTEENLDYLLQQEYSLSQMCYKADQLTLEVLESTEDFSKDIEIINTDKNDKMDVEQDAATNGYLIDQNKSGVIELLTTKPAREVVNVDIRNGELISIHNPYESVYNFEVMIKERDNSVIKKTVDHKFKKRSKNVSIAVKEVEDTYDLGNNPVVFKTLNLINISRALKSHKALHTNCNINNILQVKNSLQNFSCLKLLGNEICSRKMKQITLPFDMGTGMYQNLFYLVQKLIKEYVDMKVPENIDSTIKDNKDSSEVGLALISATPQNTLVSNYMSYDASKISYDEIRTVFNSPTVFNNKIIELDSLEAYTSTINCIEDVVPAKSNLKRKISIQLNNKKNKLKKSGLKFTNVTTIYFERSQGFSSVPTKGGSTLGMANHHFYINTISLEEHEYKKMQKEVPKRRTNNIFYRKTDKPKTVQALSLSQRIELLESSEVQIEVKEEDDCAYIRSSRASAGCDCKDYCDPDVCDCNLAGIECQVDRPNFPCGCSKENCRNAMGRNEYNHGKVRLHFSKTIRKIKSENKGRVSRRKQASPSKVFINNLNSETDIDMIAV